MMYEEAIMVMSLVEKQVEFNEKILKAQFKNRANQIYVLLFDCGTPNRVKQWSAFTDEEVKEYTKFRDVHPCPPITLPYQK